MNPIWKNLFAVFGISSCLVGCMEITTVTLNELEELKNKCQEPKVSAWYYMGTNKNYHYFIHNDLPKPKVYRIDKNEMEVKDIFEYNKDRKKWRLMNWGIRNSGDTMLNY
jgi:hypothetical protein